jgi:hypothetical protein
VMQTASYALQNALLLDVSAASQCWRYVLCNFDIGSIWCSNQWRVARLGTFRWTAVSLFGFLILGDSKLLQSCGVLPAVEIQSFSNKCSSNLISVYNGRLQFGLATNSLHKSWQFEFYCNLGTCSTLMRLHLHSGSAQHSIPNMHGYPFKEAQL